MLNPLTLDEAIKHEGKVYIEFRNFKELNGWESGVCDALYTVQRCIRHYGLSELGFCVDWRLWTDRPTDEERRRALWEEKHEHRGKARVGQRRMQQG